LPSSITSSGGECEYVLRPRPPILPWDSPIRPTLPRTPARTCSSSRPYYGGGASALLTSSLARQTRARQFGDLDRRLGKLRGRISPSPHCPSLRYTYVGSGERVFLWTMWVAQRGIRIFISCKLNPSSGRLRGYTHMRKGELLVFQMRTFPWLRNTGRALEERGASRLVRVRERAFSLGARRARDHLTQIVNWREEEMS